MVPLTPEHEVCVLDDVFALIPPHACLLFSGLAAPWMKGSESNQWQSHTQQNLSCSLRIALDSSCEGIPS